jgi:hypothetical protein
MRISSPAVFQSFLALAEISLLGLSISGAHCFSLFRSAALYNEAKQTLAMNEH